jgi:hypothetical protein
MQALYRRAASLAMAFACTLIFASGCETLGKKRQIATGSETETESTKILDVQSDPSKPEPFFRSSRLPGGLSDEAREIERHMNIQ